ncbi:MAG: hypothetical protein N2258_07050 [Brevinematales bacterium]|nr:hypothetical protein [Brevinematales bacterium]
MKRFFYFFLLLAGFKFSFSIAIDFRGADFSKITNIVQSMEAKGVKIDFVILDNPFRTTKEGGIYDFEYENISVKEISSFLSQKGINSYIYLSLFNQPKYFSRRLWNLNDFKKESTKYSFNYVLNYSSPITKNKIKGYLSIINSKGYKISLDLSTFQDKEVEDIVQSFANELENSIFFVNNKLSRVKGKSVCASYYWDLRRKFFLFPEADFKGIDNFNLAGEINLIESDEFSINNISAICYMIIKKEKILVNYKLLNPVIIEMIDFLEKDNFKRIYFSDKIMIFSSGNKVFVINLYDNFSAFDIDNNFDKKNGVYFSLTGGGVLKVDRKLNFFLFPGTVSCYYLN